MKIKIPTCTALFIFIHIFIVFSFLLAILQSIFRKIAIYGHSPNLIYYNKFSWALSFISSCNQSKP